MGNDAIQTCGGGTDYSFVYLNWGSYSAKKKKKYKATMKFESL